MSFETTKNYNEYLQYKYLKETFVCKYKGINLIEAISVDIVETLVCQQQKKIKNILNILFLRLDIRSIYEAFCQYKTVFTFDVPNRKDHFELISIISNEVENSKVITLKYYYKLWFNVLLFLKYYFLVSKKIKISFKNRIFIASHCIFFIRIINSLNKYFIENTYFNQIYVPLNSSAYTEAVLTLFFRQKNMKTFHIFHGIFGRYRQFIPNDVVNGENILSRKILAFNQTQKEDLIRDFEIQETKIVVAGSPKYPSKCISMKNSFTSCIILGGIAQYDNYLIELLDLIEKLSIKLSIKFYFKPHPSFKIMHTYAFRNYKNINVIDSSITLQKLFESGNYDFTITHNTSSYYECMYYGILPLRWKLGENIDFEGFEDKFCDEKSFLNIIQKYQNMNIETFNSEVVDLLITSYGMGINRYKEFIQ